MNELLQELEKELILVWDFEMGDGMVATHHLEVLRIFNKIYPSEDIKARIQFQEKLGTIIL